MNWKHLIAPIVCLLVVAFCAVAYVQEREDKLRAELSAHEHDAVMAERQRSYESQIAELEKERTSIKTAPQAQRVIEKYIPIAGQSLVVPPLSITPDVKAQLPDAPSYTVRTEAGEVAIAQAAVKCQEDLASLGKCQLDLKDTAKERDAYKTAVKGGSFFVRVKRNVKWFVIGLAAGGVATVIAKH